VKEGINWWSDLIWCGVVTLVMKIVYISGVTKVRSVLALWGLGNIAYGIGWNGTVFMCSLMHLHRLRMDGVYIIQFAHAYGASSEECKQWESLWFVRISLSSSSIYVYTYVCIDT
jgi:hypothetical protein